jgi:tRNA (guanine-N7-)-methyltransferase
MARRATGGARPRREFYGRRSGKTLRPNQKRLMAELLPRVALRDVDPEKNPERRPLSAEEISPAGRPVWLEIGFGGGEHLAAQAAAHPEVELIGAEAFVNGVASLLGHVEARGLGNVRVHFGDARDLLEVLPPASIARVFLLYPDPWPKLRHHRRRFVGPENLAALARVMASGAELRIASDIPDYVAHALAALAEADEFAPVVAGPPGWAEPWAGWPGTRYEAKALREGRVPHYLTFRRV